MILKKMFPILFLFLSFNFYAQSEKTKVKRDQLKAMKVAFLTNELNLSTSEAEKFWPIYNAYEDKKFELRHQKMREYLKKMQNDELNKLSEKDASELLNQIEDTEEDIFYLRKKFISSLKPVLPSAKIIKLSKAKEDFNRKLLRQYKDSGLKK